jgi:hypothetical protein
VKVTCRRLGEWSAADSRTFQVSVPSGWGIAGQFHVRDYAPRVDTLCQDCRPRSIPFRPLQTYNQRLVIAPGGVPALERVWSVLPDAVESFVRADEELALADGGAGRDGFTEIVLGDEFELVSQSKDGCLALVG